MTERFTEETFQQSIKEWSDFVEKLATTIQPMTLPKGLFSIRARYSNHWRHDDAMKVIKDNL